VKISEYLPGSYVDNYCAIFLFILLFHLTPSPPPVVLSATVDELSSIVIWVLLFGLCLEAMSLEFGFALGTFVHMEISDFVRDDYIRLSMLQLRLRVCVSPPSLPCIQYSTISSKLYHILIDI
jgi:hypothetical protein